MSSTGWLSLSGFAVAVVFDTGVLLVALHLRRRRGAWLIERIAPYLGELPRAARPGRSLRRFVLGGARSVALVMALDHDEGLSRRLTRAGREPDTLAFRSAQLAAATFSGLCGVLGGGALWARGRVPAYAAVLLVLAAVGLGWMTYDAALTAGIRRRQRAMASELPTLAELFALAVTAGEGTVAALERVHRASRGEASQEFGRCLADIRSGAGVTRAWRAMAERNDFPDFRRFVDTVVVALDRGTPLAEVMRHQAADIRESARRRLLEEAGVREIAMLVPVVFLILPVTVAFAVYPGLVALRIAW